MSADECGCDFIQIADIAGVLTELHHVIPDDGAPHTEDTECACLPDVERLAPALIVVDHHDQDTDLALTR